MKTFLNIEGATGSTAGSSSMNPASQPDYLLQHAVRVANSLTHGRARFLGKVAKMALAYANKAEETEGEEFWEGFDEENAIFDFALWVENSDRN